MINKNINSRILLVCIFICTYIEKTCWKTKTMSSFFLLPMYVNKCMKVYILNGIPFLLTT